jgi:ribonuclease HII
MRFNLETEIKEKCIWGVGSATCEEIDALNVLNADFLAMRRAIENLQKNFPTFDIRKELVIVDGSERPNNMGALIPMMNLQCVVKADAKYPEVMAASILAKVKGDHWICCQIESEKYEWEQNFGYGTKKHIELINKYGFSKIHRKSFNIKGVNIKI